MCSDGKTFPFHQRAGNAGEHFAKRIFRRIQGRQKLCPHLFVEPARPGDVKSVATTVNDCSDIDTLANIIEVAAAGYLIVTVDAEPD